MTKVERSPDYDDRYEYFGHTAIERVRLREGSVVRRDWIIFDSLEAASRFFHCFCGEGT